VSALNFLLTPLRLAATGRNLFRPAQWKWHLNISRSLGFTWAVERPKSYFKNFTQSYSGVVLLRAVISKVVMLASILGLTWYPLVFGIVVLLSCPLLFANTCLYYYTDTNFPLSLDLQTDELKVLVNSAYQHLWNGRVDFLLSAARERYEHLGAHTDNPAYNLCWTINQYQAALCLGLRLAEYSITAVPLWDLWPFIKTVANMSLLGECGVDTIIQLRVPPHTLLLYENELKNIMNLAGQAKYPMT